MTYDPEAAQKELARILEREALNRRQRRLFAMTRFVFYVCCTLAAALIGSLLGRFVH